MRSLFGNAKKCYSNDEEFCFFLFFLSAFTSESGIGSAASRTTHPTPSRIPPAMLVDFFFGAGSGFLVAIITEGEMYT